MAVEQHVVENVEGADVARSQPNQNDGFSLVADVLLPAFALKSNVRQLFAKGQEEVLGR